MSKVKSPVVPKVQTRARIWCFTINNPDEKDESHLSQEKFLRGIKSLTWQIEEGEKNTPHIQGVVQFKNQMTFDTMKKKFPGAHIEVCKNFNASKHYCQKEEGRISGPYFHPQKAKKMNDIAISEYLRENNPFNFEELKEEIEKMVKRF